MCMVRDFEEKTFQIHQNGKQVYSFGDCRTIPANATCLKKGWKYSSKYRYVLYTIESWTVLILLIKMLIVVS